MELLRYRMAYIDPTVYASSTTYYSNPSLFNRIKRWQIEIRKKFCLKRKKTNSLCWQTNAFLSSVLIKRLRYKVLTVHG